MNGQDTDFALEFFSRAFESAITATYTRPAPNLSFSDIWCACAPLSGTRRRVGTDSFLQNVERDLKHAPGTAAALILQPATVEEESSYMSFGCGIQRRCAESGFEFEATHLHRVEVP